MTVMISVPLGERYTKVAEACGQCRFLSNEPDQPVDYCIAFEDDITRKPVPSGGLRRVRCNKCMEAETCAA